MAYDEALQRVVMFGGQGQGGVLGDTWLWDGSTWTSPTVTCSPSCTGLARNTQRVAYDRFTSQFVVFGGVDASGALLSDTWVLEGPLTSLVWRNVSAPSPAKPSARCCGGMAYDQAHKVVVYYGGGGPLQLAQFDDSWAGTYQIPTSTFPWRCVDGTCTPG
jgi:hypothetical protein